MPDIILLSVDSEIRLDLLLAQEWEHLRRGQIQQMILAKKIHINGLPARKVAQRLQPGDTVKVIPPVPEETEDRVLDISLPVVYEDAVLMVIDKPAGLNLRNTSRKQQTTVASILALIRPEIANVGGVGHAGLVTTLEEAASGMVLAAKENEAYGVLRRHLKRQRIKYTYTCMVEGRLRGEGLIDDRIGNARHERERLQVSREGRSAITAFRAQRHYKDTGEDYTLLRVDPETSRRHQIRIHLSWYGHPLVGDTIYGSRHQKLLTGRLFLHLGVLEFPQPFGEEILHIESPLPRELQSILTYLVKPKT